MASAKRLLSVDYQVFGKVQGVFFRKYTKQQADKLHLVGWVMNHEDGSVVGTVQGPDDKVKEMKMWLSKKGSPSSRIEKCDFKNERSINKIEFTAFQITKSNKD